MNAAEKEKQDHISFATISKQLERVLDEMKIITDEIAEMKERDGVEL